MKAAKSIPVFDQLLAQLGDCLTLESARRLLAQNADPKLRARVNDLAERHLRGDLSDEEQADFAACVYFDTFLAILRSKARQLLASSPDE